MKAVAKAAAKEAGVSVSTEQIEMPMDDQGQSKGFMFVSLDNPTEAQAFQRALHGHAFDKRHTFSVVPFTDVDSYANLDEEFKEPPKEDWAPRVRRAASLSPGFPSDSFLFLARRSTSVRGSPTRPAATR